MANRFTDSRKWDDPWFRKLPCKYKAFFLFLIDKCNHAGVWKVDIESAEFHIGEKLNKNEIIFAMEGRIIELGEKWFIPKFINFQYQVNGPENLNPANRVHKSVIDLLIKEGAYKGLIRGSQGCKDKDYDKDIKEDIKVVFDYYLLKTKKSFRLTPANEALINKKLSDGYTTDQLKKAIDSFVADDWVGRKDHLDLIYCMGAQKGKPDNLEKWLNINNTQPISRGEVR